jgi:hypothetical protein
MEISFTFNDSYNRHRGFDRSSGDMAESIIEEDGDPSKSWDLIRELESL